MYQIVENRVLQMEKTVYVTASEAGKEFSMIKEVWIKDPGI